MEIKKSAMAGTLESSDAQVTVEPGNGSVELTIESSVIHQFGRQIKFQKPVRGLYLFFLCHFQRIYLLPRAISVFLHVFFLSFHRYGKYN